jgi:DNA-directed RNA polymerase specialized sigma24 family protein
LPGANDRTIADNKSQPLFRLMLFEEPTTSHLLSGLVRRLSFLRADHDDLIQEGLIYLWTSESKSPGRTRSWYLHGCKMHLRNVMRRGSSVDSPKRRKGVASHESYSFQHLCTTRDAESSSGIYSGIWANELLDLLNQRLAPEEKALLPLLAIGLSKRSVARRLKLSHTAVLKRHRKIAQTASRLGLHSHLYS